jgi:PIN domain nuclease of toxin-antitoxin system
VNVFDASALLTFLQAEQGAAQVEEALGGSACGAANWPEAPRTTQAVYVRPERYPRAFERGSRGF